MGHLGDPRNTFWQLFSSSAGSAQWELATPPGVASNGGLVGSVIPSGTVTVGFDPALSLRFSPLAQSVDQGSTWIPGVLPGGLALVPDAVAASSAHQYSALVGNGEGVGVVTSNDLSTWRTVTSARTLAATRSLSGCGVVALTAVALTDSDSGGPVVGAACSRGGRAGVLAERNGTWQSIGPSLPASARGPTQVVRLIGTPGGATALIRAGVGRTSRLYGARSTDGLATWSVSSPLAEPGGLVSTGVSAAAQLIAVIQRGSTRSAAVLGPSGSAWQQLAPLPAGTVAVAASPGGGYSALIAHSSTLDVDLSGKTGWRHVQTLDVPIQYGSSG